MSNPATFDHSVVILSSGQTLKIKGVTLYPAIDLAEISRLRAEASVGLGGVSSGLGFIGSPEWVIGASAVVGVIEKIASSAAQKAALEKLAEAQRKVQELPSKALVFGCRQIDHIGNPNPSVWSAHVESDQKESSTAPNLEAMSRRERSIYLTSDRRYAPPPLRMVFNHSGDDFVTVDTEFGVTHIRWSAVVGYIGPR